MLVYWEHGNMPILQRSNAPRDDATVGSGPMDPTVSCLRLFDRQNLVSFVVFPSSPRIGQTRRDRRLVPRGPRTRVFDSTRWAFYLVWTFSDWFFGSDRWFCQDRVFVLASLTFPPNSSSFIRWASFFCAALPLPISLFCLLTAETRRNVIPFFPSQISMF